MIESANKLNRYPDRCHYYLNEKSDLSYFPAEHFDFIYSKIVLQHMEQVYSKAYIKEFLRILSPNGVLVFQIPDGPARAPIDNRRRSKLTKALPPDAFNARIVCTTPTRSVEADCVAIVRATVRNVSNISWPCIGDRDGMYFVRLGNHWLDADLKLLVNDDTRANLPSDLEPGETADLVLQVTAPAAPGDYVLELDMVQEGVAWFAIHGSQTTRITISVIKGSVQPPVRTAAVMEMHTVPQSEVSRIIHDGGGEIISVFEDGSSGPDFLSFSYYVKKSQNR
jgi:SAM-dependent methyltransferase